MEGLDNSVASDGLTAVIGEVVALRKDGSVLVRAPGLDDTPAWIASHVPPGHLAPSAHVLLYVATGTTTRPIVAAVLRATVTEDAVTETEAPMLRAGEASSTNKANKPARLILEADKEIQLRCGRSSLLLREDGKVQLRGADIVSRASRGNKVRGATVEIN